MKTLACILAFLTMGSLLPVARAESHIAYNEMRSPENQVFQFVQKGTYTYAPDNVVSAAAYLWIPEHCRRLRGLLVLAQNVPEHGLVGHPAIRAVCAANDLGIVWSTPSFFSLKQPTEEWKTVAFLQRLLDGLAKTSGYDEVATVPWLPMGESFHYRMLYQLLNEKPEHCIAAIFIKNAPSLTLGHNRETPVLVAVGTAQEWYQDQTDIRTHWQDLSFSERLLKERAAFPGWPLSLAIEGGSGHFDCTEEMTRYFADYIAAAVKARVPADGGALRPVAQDDGFVAGLPLPDRDAFAPLAMAKANPARHAMPWYFNEKLARDACEMAAINWKAKTQFPAFVDANGKPVPMTDRGITNPVPIRTGQDGITFEVKGCLLPAIPENFAGAGAPLAMMPGAPVAEWVSGPFAPVGNGRFRIALDRTWPKGLVCVALRHQGTTDVRDVVQPGLLRLEPNTEGRAQTITFAPVPDQVVGTASVPLVARSDSGMPVRFFVVAGPAVVDGSTLTLLPLPPRTRFPVEITVTAWQWGRSVEPRVQTAESVSRTFRILAAKSVAISAVQ